MNMTKKLALTAMLATTFVAGTAQAAEPGFYLAAPSARPGWKRTPRTSVITEKGIALL